MSYLYHNHLNDICSRNKPKKQTVEVKETKKVSEITDPFGNLRYGVVLNSYDDEDDGKYRLKYTIEVINYFSAQQPIVILRKPSDGEPPIYDYEYALRLYRNYINTYTCLVKAETRDLQDIEVYKDKIGYEKTQPACCMTCKWCRKKVTPHRFIYEDTNKLECTNPENCHEFSDDPSFCGMHNHDFRQPYDLHSRNPVNLLYPVVDPLGICDHYLLKMRDQVPVPGQSITEFIDYRLGQRIDKKIQKVTSETISSSLSSDLSVPVIQAITMVLSSPDASVALSAPVVNLITNSETINAHNVNVIANAISTDVMYQPMVNAVASTMHSPEISDAMKEPVSNVLPSEEVSGIVADTAAKGITIEKIVGNSGEAFKDKNNNGIPDEYESQQQNEMQEDDSNDLNSQDASREIAFGGLGA